MVFRYKSYVNGLRIGLPFFEPERISFAVTKTFQVWVSVFAFVVNKGCDAKWLQSLGIKKDCKLEFTICNNNVDYHIFVSCNRVPDWISLRIQIEKEIGATESEGRIPGVQRRLAESGFLYVELFNLQVQRGPRNSELDSRPAGPRDFSLALSKSRLDEPLLIA